MCFPAGFRAQHRPVAQLATPTSLCMPVLGRKRHSKVRHLALQRSSGTQMESRGVQVDPPAGSHWVSPSPLSHVDTRRARKKRYTFQQNEAVWCQLSTIEPHAPNCAILGRVVRRRAAQLHNGAAAAAASKQLSSSVPISDNPLTVGDLARGYEYYIRFLHLDRRWDRWVPAHLLTPATKSQVQKSTQAATSRKAQVRKLLRGAGASPKKKYRLTKARKMREAVSRSDDEDSMSDSDHDEEHMVKHVELVVFGQYEMRPWYASAHPDPYCKHRILYICDRCFKYMDSEAMLQKHLGIALAESSPPASPASLPSSGSSSTLLALSQNEELISSCEFRDRPPGEEIYHDPSSNLHLFYVDGAKFSLYCQCLCLMVRMFLDHKSVCYDVEPFDFFILCKSSNTKRKTYDLVGYFSKEKNNQDRLFNLSCILVWPMYQQRGYGQFLIATSYEITRRKQTVGAPERPLSDLGAASFGSYWKKLITITLYERALEALRQYTGHSNLLSSSCRKEMAGLISYRGGKIDVSAEEAVQYDLQLNKTGENYVSSELAKVTIADIAERTGMIPQDVIQNLVRFGWISLERAPKSRKHDGSGSSVVPLSFPRLAVRFSQLHQTFVAIREKMIRRLSSGYVQFKPEYLHLVPQLLRNGASK